jgi:hypothetical protein
MRHEKRNNARQRDNDIVIKPDGEKRQRNQYIIAMRGERLKLDERRDTTRRLRRERRETRDGRIEECAT